MSYPKNRKSRGYVPPKCHPGRKLWARGLCNACYKAWWKEQHPERAKEGQQASSHARYMRKWYAEHPDQAALAVSRREAATRRREKHRVELLEYQRNWTKHNAHRLRWYRLKHAHGLTREGFEQLWAEQKGCCAVCVSDLAGLRVHVDHCHATSKIRGLLCSTCNRGLGQFKDDEARLRRAADYLAFHLQKNR